MSKRGAPEISSTRAVARMFSHSAAVVVGVLLLGSCSTGPMLSQAQASQEGWAWGLKVQSGSVTCDKGVSGPEIGFIPSGSKVDYALSSNATADARVRPSDSRFTYAQLGDIWDGTSPFRPFLDAAWRSCGYNGGASDYEVYNVMGNGYQS